MTLFRHLRMPEPDHFIKWMPLLPDIPPEQMTPRARLYLLATSAYCLSMGLSTALVADRFTSVTFNQIRSMAPGGMHGWTAAHFIVGACAFIAAWRGSERWAYGALMGATVMVGSWAAGFWLAFLTQSHVAPSGMIAYSFITLIHLIQARQPLRSPFDPVFRSLPNR